MSLRQPGPTGLSHGGAQGLPGPRRLRRVQLCPDPLCFLHPLPGQDGRTQGFMEPAERVTQSLSVSRVTWKEHFSLEQMGESESPTPLSPP